ncbi:hypothetical protein MNB_SV-13-787 [hydrothermal vent metagenome]|uniref:Uncharacterized protein n=1 Tax=hydrothermal vent metagenome TaxID=652676 RepID=A0A1W1CZX5_9ZZZZ
MTDLYDPYRNAVRQTLQDKAIEKRKKDFIEKANKNKAKKFLKKKIYLSDFINLPEGLANSIFLGLFITIPYFFGIIFIFIVLAKANFHIYETIGNSFAFSWVIGYELLAGILLLIILKSSINFR